MQTESVEPSRAREFEYERGIISAADRRRPAVRVLFPLIVALLLIALVLACVAPLIWLAKSAISTPLDITRYPLEWFPSGEVRWDNLASAWSNSQVGRYLLNTVILGVGSVATTLFTSITGGFVLSVMRPKWGPFLTGAVLVVLFVPFVVTLVPVYKVILDLPVTGGSLLNTYWAVWLPTAASAFGLLLMKRFFDALPRELFEAARVDGAGPIRTLVAIVIPLSRPVIGVLAVLAFVTSYKDYLWPSLVLRDEAVQPISVALPYIQRTVDLGELMAALFIAVLIPIAAFLLFQRWFLRGLSAAGGVKG